MSYQYLVVSDTNNITEYIYSSPKYKMIRGASVLLDKLNTIDTLEIAKKYNGEVLSTGGGEARILFKNEDDAEGYKASIQRKYLEETDEVSLTIVNVKRLENELLNDWLSRAEEQLRLYEIKNYKKKVHNLNISPIMKRCDSCEQRVAEKGLRIEDQQCCRSCYNKERAFRNYQSSSRTLTGIGKVYEKLKNYNFKKVEQISDLVSKDPSERNIGFIYADGKAIGQLFKGQLEKVTDDEKFIQKYRHVSERLKEALIEAAVEAYKTCVNKGMKNLQIDFSFIGGDDFAAITNAKYAIIYTYYLLQYFTKYSKEYLKEGKHLAAGIIIAKDTYPIYQLYNLAYELMAKTKAESKESTLDFFVVDSSNIQSIEEKRVVVNSGNKRDLYVRSYKIGKSDEYLSFKDLYSVAVKLKKANFPASKIKAIYHITTEPSELLMEFEWKEWLSRLKREHKQIFYEWHKDFRKTPFPFKRNGVAYTPLRDLFDIYEYVDKEVIME